MTIETMISSDRVALALWAELLIWSPAVTMDEDEKQF